MKKDGKQCIESYVQLIKICLSQSSNESDINVTRSVNT